MNAAWLKQSTWSVLVALLAIGLVAEGADKRKKNSSDSKKPAATDDDPAGDGADKDVFGSKGKDPKEKDPAPASDDDDNAFGAGRAKMQGKRVDESELAENKDKAKFVKALRKKLREEEGFYVLMTMEKGYEKNEHANPNAQANGGQPQPPYTYYEHLNFEVLGGREATVGFIVDFVEKYNPPWEKKSKSSSRKRDEEEEASNFEPPKPLRDWQMLEWFPDETYAEAYRTQRQNAYQAEIQHQKDIQTPVRRGRYAQ